MIPYISNLPSTFANTPEYQSWVEKFLSRYCSLSSRRLTAHIKDPHTPLSPTAKMLLGSALASFRVYTKTLDAKKTPHGGKPSSSLSVWRAYYNTITTFLKNDLVQPMFQSKLQLFEELKSAESAYEAILLKEVSFPRADQASTTIETWVDQVIANWRVICRFTWRKEDFGEADRVAVSRGVLDVGRLVLVALLWSIHIATLAADGSLHRSFIELPPEHFIPQEFWGISSPFMRP